jgi:crotonobetainyl-CoA:carnitine CoA-transferase CaiB-like acyl-CoA transferase
VLSGDGPAGFPYEPGYGVFRSRDGVYLALGVAHEDHFWRALCEVTGLAGERGLGSAQRFADSPRLRAALVAVIATRDAADWEAAFERNDIPFGRVRSLPELAGSPQVRARGLLVREPGGARTHVRQPLGVDDLAPGPGRGVPLLGAHTVEVLTEAGVPAALVEAALADGAAEQYGVNRAEKDLTHKGV